MGYHNRFVAMKRIPLPKLSMHKFDHLVEAGFLKITNYQKGNRNKIDYLNGNP